MSTSTSSSSRPYDDNMPQSRQSRMPPEHMAHSTGIPQRLRNEESWVEISSQPSSSSLSSIGDEIVTTGLRVQHDPNSRRRRRVASILPQAALLPRHAGTSSQEEYDESESEDDRVLTSSTERISPSSGEAPSRPEYDAGSDSDDDDENKTALGRRTSASTATFTPQPNAFSHPPSSHAQRHSSHGSYFPSQRSIRHDRPSPASRTSSQAADHDAALRASLTTLLSIGAAGRSLPKRDQSGLNGPPVHSREPIGLRFVPESELNIPTIPANTSRPLSPSTRAKTSPSITSQEAADQGKRKAASIKASGDRTRPLKKKKVQGLEAETLISPTMMAWFMSAGVVVLVSVVGFGAGYVIGREVGRQEVMAGLNGSSLAEGSNCGREVARGASLRRFRWNISSAATSVAA